MTLNKRTVEIDAERLERLEAELNWFKNQRDKLVALVLLADPSVVSMDMNSLSATQWVEFTRWYQAMRPKDMPDHRRIAEAVSSCQDAAHVAEV